MAIDPGKVSLIKKIISVFETGKTSGNYGTVTILEDGAGISYGIAQATDKAGTLDTIVMRYIDLGGLFAKALEPYLDALEHDLTSTVDPNHPPVWVTNLESILKSAGESDSKMKVAQDQVFDENFWQPALNQSLAMKLVHPLSYAIIYDTCIHSGPGGVNRIRKLFPEYPPSSGGDEKKWAEAYIRARRAWLAASPTAAVRKTVYRMDAFLEMMKNDNWELDKPITILGVKIQ